MPPWLDFHWLDRDHILNGLVAHGIAMGFEALVIVQTLDWFKRRDENRRLRPFRQRTRSLLRRSLAHAIENLVMLLDRIVQYQSEIAASPVASLPSPASVADLMHLLKRAHDDLGRDYVSRLLLLDDATREIFDAWLEQMESLFATWPCRRIMQPDFLSDWGRFADSEDRRLIASLPGAGIEIEQRLRIAQSIDAMLVYAETQRGGDRRLLKEAAKLKAVPISG